MKSAQVLSVLSRSSLYHPDSKREMSVYVVAYIREDAVFGSTSLFLYSDDPHNDDILNYPLIFDVEDQTS